MSFIGWVADRYLMGFRRLRQEILDDDWEGAADEMRGSNWYRVDTRPRAGRMVKAWENNSATHLFQSEDPYDGG